VIKGLYRFAVHAPDGEARARVRLIGSGTILREVIEAAALLAQDWQVHAEVWSATSFSELARDAAEVERWNRLHPEADARTAHVRRCLAGDNPVIAASDHVRAWPQLIASHVRAPFVALGTDGFGRSDTRAALRRFFEVDRHQLVLAALDASHEQGRVDAALCMQAIVRYGIDTDSPPCWRR
jgi:pyruvate dehydrogenase E1 component